MKLILLLSVVIGWFAAPAVANPFFVEEETVSVPLGGNTWQVSGKQERRWLSEAGIKGWKDAGVQYKVYVRLNGKGALNISLKGKAASAAELDVTINGISKKVDVKSGATLMPVGNFNIPQPGYYAITVKGIRREGELFPDLSSIEMSGSALDTAPDFVKNNEGNFFYWGRRGPSVHLNYPFPDSIKAEYFYNEITVPEGNDVIGSYYMANGFGEGYFGIQVNSETERRVLFSVWSPFQTDDPASIPEDQKIILLKKGEGVHTGEFGNEGSGGQSFLRYNWKTGNTYKFLLKGVPDGPEHTVYTAWFFAPEESKWLLIASFRRPKKSTYLKRFHSFLENFSPDQGDQERKVLFGNQWIRDNHGKWHELTSAGFTGDNTARQRFRLDYGGGVEGNRFFLRNCGFFSDFTPLDSKFEREKGEREILDFEF